MRRLISRDVLRVATRKSWVLILRIRPDHLFGVGTIYSARTFCQQFFWGVFFGCFLEKRRESVAINFTKSSPGVLKAGLLRVTKRTRPWQRRMIRALRVQARQ